MFELKKTEIPGVVEILPHVLGDERGTFIKLLHDGFFSDHGMETPGAESYLTESREGVVRGLHFQLPPNDHSKLVGCIHGTAWDVAVDLRIGSPTYARHVVRVLESSCSNMLFFPRGIAHGFCVPRGTAVMLYFTSSVHAPDFDTGIRWDSAGINWPIANPTVSDRDLALPKLKEFVSPFYLEGSA